MRIRRNLHIDVSFEMSRLKMSSSFLLLRRRRRRHFDDKHSIPYSLHHFPINIYRVN